MQYNLEIYDADFNLFAHTPVQTPYVVVDYVSEEHTTLTAPKAIDGLSISMYARLKTGKNVIYEGIVMGYSIDDTTKAEKISCVPLKSLLNLDVRNTAGTTGMMAWLKRMYEAYILPGMPVFEFSVTSGDPDINEEITAHLTDSKLVNLNDVLISVLRDKSIRVEFSIDIIGKKIKASWKKTEGVRKINAAVSDVISCVLDDTTSVVNGLPINAAVCIDTDNSTDTAVISKTYYWIPSDDGMIGTVSESSDGVILPVRYTMLEVKAEEGQTFADAAQAAAKSALYSTKYDAQMTITYRASSKIISPPEVGAMYLIRSNGIDRYSICTGYQMTGTDEMQITLGCARRSLSQIIRSVIRK